MPGVYKSRAAVAGGSSGAIASGATAASERAVLNALRWLKSVQEEDGAWSLASGGGPVGKHSTGATPAMTGLALLAYLAHGETPNSEEFGPTVEKGLRWLQRAQESDGRFSGRDNHDYSHPIATFALCEAYGMTKNPLLAPVAEPAPQSPQSGAQQPDNEAHAPCPNCSNPLDLSTLSVGLNTCPHCSQAFEAG